VRDDKPCAKLLAALAMLGEASRKDLEAATGLTKIEATGAVQHLMRSNSLHPKRIYVKSWVGRTADVARAYPRPVYALGDLPDAPRPTGRARQGTGLLGAEIGAKIIAAIEQHGPMSRRQLTGERGLTRQDLCPVLAAMVAPQKGRKLHISHWEHVNEGGPVNSWRPVYALGDEQDAPRPKAAPAGVRPLRRRTKAKRLEPGTLDVPLLSRKQLDTPLGRCRTSIFDFA
jgi:hypothetical protein